MSRYYLTEAYGELHNPRFTEDHYYDNLRFVDCLQTEQIEEVMESLIWEFMDYGDTLDEAVDTLNVTFSDDGEILNESLDLITEAQVTMGMGSELRARADAEKRNAEVQRRARNISDLRTKARRAERSSAVRGAVSSAARSIGGALKAAHTATRNRISRAGTAAQEKAKAALTKVGRVGRAVVGGVQGAYGAAGTAAKLIQRGAKRGATAAYHAEPQKRLTRSGYEQNKSDRAAAAKASVGNAFAEPSGYKYPPKGMEPSFRAKGGAIVPVSKPRPTSSGYIFPPAMNTAPKQGKGGAIVPVSKPRPKGGSMVQSSGGSIVPTRIEPVSVRTMAQTQRRLSPSSGSGLMLPARAQGNITSDYNRPPGKRKPGSYANIDARLAARRAKNAAKKLTDSVDYDLLTQYMIEDLINEGYAQSENDAAYILENMSTRDLNKFAMSYLED